MNARLTSLSSLDPRESCIHPYNTRESAFIETTLVSLSRVLFQRMQNTRENSLKQHSWKTHECCFNECRLTSVQRVLHSLKQQSWVLVFGLWRLSKTKDSCLHSSNEDWRVFIRRMKARPSFEEWRQDSRVSRDERRKTKGLFTRLFRPQMMWKHM